LADVIVVPLLVFFTNNCRATCMKLVIAFSPVVGIQLSTWHPDKVWI
jgi:hypothetical protein